MSLPSLTDFEAHLAGGGDESEKDDLLEAAVGIVENLVGPLEVTTVTEVHYGVSGGPLVLRKVPAVALVSVSNWTGVEYTELTLSDYVLDPATGIVRTPASAVPSGDFQVTYTAGRSEVPVAIRTAILIIAAHLFETQRVPGASFGRVPGFGGSEGEAAMPAGRGFAVPNRAMSLLEPYLLGPVIA